MAADPADVLLSSKVTIAQYREMEASKDQTAISNFIKQRFTERYITALSQDKKGKNGFAITALACLMIEALESFRCGWPRTDGRGRQAFEGFFARYSQFDSLAPAAAAFYANVRCGLLHQAETRGGWRIRRAGPLFDPVTRTLNATKLMSEVESALWSYCDQLSSEPWTSDVWTNLRKKMTVVCKNALGAD